MKTLKPSYLKLAIYFICAVCIYDIYCTVKLNELLYINELNPVAKLLIEVEEVKLFKSFNLMDKKEYTFLHINVAKLVLFKVLGLVAALEIFDWLINSKHKRCSQIIILTVFIIHLALLLFLTVV